MQIYISHVAADRDVARHLSEALEAAGLLVWNPETSIFPGDNWAIITGNALAQSQVLVAIFSRNVSGTETVQRDVQFALTSGNYRSRVIPVLLDFTTFEVGTDVPWLLLRLQPLYAERTTFDAKPIVERVKATIEAGSHAAS